MFDMFFFFFLSSNVAFFIYWLSFDRRSFRRHAGMVCGMVCKYTRVNKNKPNVCCAEELKYNNI